MITQDQIEDDLPFMKDLWREKVKYTDHEIQEKKEWKEYIKERYEELDRKKIEEQRKELERKENIRIWNQEILESNIEGYKKDLDFVNEKITKIKITMKGIKESHPSCESKDLKPLSFSNRYSYEDRVKDDEEKLKIINIYCNQTIALEYELKEKRRIMKKLFLMKKYGLDVPQTSELKLDDENVKYFEYLKEME